ncbi:MAG TPA: hypothetical protein VMT62_05045 [Syntrophorhabdaceae bacterium]|nr:hypothetical protein [Syntrophorhabdaceae bacterium]
MRKGKNTAEILDRDDELEDMEWPDDNTEERTLILKAAPPSRRAQLMAHGAMEIRCAHCDEIRPLASAEECDEGWLCEDCVREMTRKPKFGGQRGR